MLILMQGPPGSGKSTLAGKVQEVVTMRCESCAIVSTDTKHMEGGEYKFNREKLGEYHAETQQECRELLAKGYNVLVDNCNILRLHTAPYVYMAGKDATIITIRCLGTWANIHGVPSEAVDRMRAGIEWPDCNGWEVEALTDGTFNVHNYSLGAMCWVRDISEVFIYISQYSIIF